MGILRYIQCETLRRGLIKSLWTAVSLRRAIVNFHCHTHIFTLVATNTHSSRIFMHALYVAYQPLINAEVGRAYEVTRLGTLPNTFFRSTKACTLSCWRHGIFLLGGMQWIWRLWRCGKAWNMIACHRWALVVVGRSEPPSLEPSWHGLAIPAWQFPRSRTTPFPPQRVMIIRSSNSVGILAKLSVTNLLGPFITTGFQPFRYNQGCISSLGTLH